MSNIRYHAHLACIASDPLLQAVQDDIAIFAENRLVLTTDLRMMRNRSANYSWRCISACDVVILLIGSCYGQTNLSGVSQLHLSYSNARATKKPLVVLAHYDVKESQDRHLLDFMRLVENQVGESVHYFDESKNVFAILEATVGKFINQKEADDNANNPPVLPNKSAIIAHTKTEHLSEIRTQKFANHDMVTDSSLKPALALDNEFLVDCSAHAFEGGALNNVTFSFEMTWRQIITALIHVASPFSNQAFSRCLNEQIDKQKVNAIVKAKYPNVHAVSRYQVVKADAFWIQDELHLAGHIIPVHTQGSNVFWELTPNAKAIIHQSNQENIMTDQASTDLKQELAELTEKMHDAEKKRTLEEQVAYMKSRGINPATSYAKWDEEED